MIYLDTSFLAPLFREENATEKVTAFLSVQDAGSLAISKWTKVEFASLLAREVRMNVLNPEEAELALEEFHNLATASLAIWLPDARDFDLAAEYVAKFETGLRGPDALHLAIARNRGAEFVATLDEGMQLAASMLGIPAGEFK